MNILLSIIRWVLVLPASLAALVMVYALARLFDYVSVALANFYFGPTGDIFGVMLCSFLAGGTYVMAGVATAPGGKRFVALLLASLPALLSFVVIALSVINYFDHFGTPHYSSVLRTICVAVGAAMAAREIWKDISAVGRPQASSRTTPSNTGLVECAGEDEETEGEQIDFDALTRGLDDEGDEMPS